MSVIKKDQDSSKPDVTVDDVNRVLDIGRLLLSVLAEEEIKELHRLINAETTEVELGNMSVT